MIVLLMFVVAVIVIAVVMAFGAVAVNSEFLLGMLVAFIAVVVAVCSFAMVVLVAFTVAVTVFMAVSAVGSVHLLVWPGIIGLGGIGTAHQDERGKE